MKLRIYIVSLTLLAAAFSSVPAAVAQLKIVSLNRRGDLTWTNALPTGVLTVEQATTTSGPWVPLKNVFSTTPVGSVRTGFSSGRGFIRLLNVDISATPQGYQNLRDSYSILETIAGLGNSGADGYNAWEPQFEGGLATEAELSRPHMAVADDAGNVYVADKDSHAIRKITLDGKIVTVAGRNSAGDDGDKPGRGTERRLSSPNGLWVRGDSTVYILDLGNAKIRKLATNGVMTTMFVVNGGIVTGRGLWVQDDENLVYFASETAVKKWTPNGGVKIVANGFTSLGNLVVDPAGRLVVTDRGGHRVYRLSSSGNKTVIAGNGETIGGGDGALALETGLNGVRGIWFLPNGGYLLATHEGSQIWYVDSAGVIHLFLDGVRNAHNGDGENFKTPGFKVSEVRAVTMDKHGNIIITENDVGFIRRLRFLRDPLPPLR